MHLFIASFFTAALTAQEFNANIEKTNVKWEGKKVVAGGHYGTVNLKSGTLVFKDGEAVKGKIVIDMTSLVNTDGDGKNDRLVGHLMSDDFFGVERYPEATFVLKRAKASDNGMMNFSGDLTVKGKTSPVSFSSTVEKGDNSLMFEGKMKVDRTLYDVRYGSGKFFENLGDKAINDIFTLEFKLFLEK